MWLTQSFDGLIIIVLIGIVLLIPCIMFYSEGCSSFFYTLKLRYMIGSFKILVITNKEQAKKACASLKSHCQDLNAVGFDCEWITVDGKPRPVALLQLASCHGLCCLFRLNILGEIPNELKEILHDANIIKLGICPRNDSKFLLRDYNVQVQSTLDLNHLYPKCGGLASLAWSVIGIKLNKRLWLKCSNWENPKLTYSQRDYAAKDALVAIEIFKKWIKTNSKTRFGEQSETTYDELLDEDLKLTISRNLDVPFKEYKPPTLREKKIKAGYVARKTPLYDNIYMHAPNGQLLCSCDKRKAEWYLTRGLAEVLPGEPFSIRLLFKPKIIIDDNEEGRYYQEFKQNCCVVCGNEKFYLRHSVVPREYRKHFPLIMKDHQSHDVVLVCIRCHQIINEHNQVFKQKLAALCNITPDTKVTHLREPQRIRDSAKALLKAGDVMPIEKKNQLENLIKNYFKVDSITPELLENATQLETLSYNPNYESHGYKVVNHFKQEEGGLMMLERLWREHFLETMKPQFLPARWSVTYNHSRVAENLMKKRY